MYVRSPKYWRKQKHEQYKFFRTVKRTPADDESMADDQPLDESKHIPTFTESLEHARKSNKAVKCNQSKKKTRKRNQKDKTKE